MAKQRRAYVLTETAALDFREAKRWSMARRGRKQTQAYFRALHEGAEHIAAHQAAIAKREDLTGETGLGAHPVGEHYLVYVPIDDERIAIVALIRQIRDVPEIIKANFFQLERALRAALRSEGGKPKPS